MLIAPKIIEATEKIVYFRCVSSKSRRVEIPYVSYIERTLREILKDVAHIQREKQFTSLKSSLKARTSHKERQGHPGELRMGPVSHLSLKENNQY